MAPLCVASTQLGLRRNGHNQRKNVTNLSCSNSPRSNSPSTNSATSSTATQLNSRQTVRPYEILYQMTSLTLPMPGGRNQSSNTTSLTFDTALEKITRQPMA